MIPFTKAKMMQDKRGNLYMMRTVKGRSYAMPVVTGRPIPLRTKKAR